MSSLVTVHLQDCKLHGEFPKHFFRLPKLQEIDLSQNPSLHGSLPEFPHRSALRNLLIKGSSFHGSIPSSIGNLTQLQSMDLSSNYFSGSIPSSIGNLTQLQSIDLSSNYFSGSIPSSIGNLWQLENLFLSTNNFLGKIPDSIANLTALTFLDLSSNNLSGSIPSLILPTNNMITSNLSQPNGGLLRLISLNFSENSLEGMIDYSLFILPSLESLDLQMNQFQALPAQAPYKPSPFLSEIYLSDNILQGPLPGWIAQLTSLEILNLSSNEFNSSMDMDAFSNMTSLNELYLSDNHFWSITASPNNSTFPRLRVFESHSCNVVEFPTFLRNASSLMDLDMSNSRIKGQIPSWIWTDSLDSLNLSSNLLTGLDWPSPNASNILVYFLDLHSNNLQGPVPLLSEEARYLDYSKNSLTSFTPDDYIASSLISKASFFSVSGNSLAGTIPKWICNASSLEVLDLSNNNLDGTIPSCLGNFSSSLSVLNLGGNGLQGSMPHIYAESLTTLLLNGNRLQGKVPSSLYNCQKLEVLDLGNNQINDIFPFRFEKLLRLQVLILRSNKFYGQIKGPRRTKNAFPMLHVIDLSSNGFTGQLPPEYFHTWRGMMMMEKDKKSEPNYLGVRASNGYYEFRTSIAVTMKGGEFHLQRILDVFTSIDLSNNLFEGKIPELIGDSKSLIVLNLSGNNLHGSIPSSMENLHRLEPLDLSDNKLTGEIPVELESLTFLSFLNLSRNNLEGFIPTGRQFNTFTPQSYEGNPLLCGFPLSKKCRVGEEAKPPTRDQNSSDSRIQFDWNMAWKGYGCGVVAELSIGYILFWGDGVFAQSIPIKMQHPPSRRRRRGRRT